MKDLLNKVNDLICETCPNSKDALIKIHKEKIFYHSIFFESKSIDQIEVRRIDNTLGC